MSEVSGAPAERDTPATEGNTFFCGVVGGERKVVVGGRREDGTNILPGGRGGVEEAEEDDEGGREELNSGVSGGESMAAVGRVRLWLAIGKRCSRLEVDIVWRDFKSESIRLRIDSVYIYYRKWHCGQPPNLSTLGGTVGGADQ